VRARARRRAGRGRGKSIARRHPARAADGVSSGGWCARGRGEARAMDWKGRWIRRKECVPKLEATSRARWRSRARPRRSLRGRGRRHGGIARGAWGRVWRVTARVRRRDWRMIPRTQRTQFNGASVKSPRAVTLVRATTRATDGGRRPVRGLGWNRVSTRGDAREKGWTRGRDGWERANGMRILRLTISFVFTPSTADRATTRWLVRARGARRRGWNPEQQENRDGVDVRVRYR